MNPCDFKVPGRLLRGRKIHPEAFL